MPQDGTVVTPDVAAVDQELVNHTVKILLEEDKPWAGWGLPEAVVTNMGATQIRLGAEGTLDENHLVFYANTLDGEVKVGRATPNALRELGWHAQFPRDFVERLTPHMQVAVINERLTRSENKEFTFIRDRGEFSNVVPGWRDVLPYAYSAQVTYDALKERYGADLEVKEAVSDNGTMSCRFLTPETNPITPKVGDALRLGVGLRQQYGDSIWTDLYVERLLCLNGMRGNKREFSWRSKVNAGWDAQVDWLRNSVGVAVDTYGNTVERARTMASTELHGDPREVLREHARAMRLPRRYHEALNNAFDVEPGNTIWDLVNAFTRLATHGGLRPDLSRSVQEASGDYVSNFEMVTARLPRPIANSVGAEIVEAVEA